MISAKRIALITVISVTTAAILTATIVYVSESWTKKSKEVKNVYSPLKLNAVEEL